MIFTRSLVIVLACCATVLVSNLVANGACFQVRDEECGECIEIVAGNEGCLGLTCFVLEGACPNGTDCECGGAITILNNARKKAFHNAFGVGKDDYIVGGQVDCATIVTCETECAFGECVSGDDQVWTCPDHQLAGKLCPVGG